LQGLTRTLLENTKLTSVSDTFFAASHEATSTDALVAALSVFARGVFPTSAVVFGTLIDVLSISTQTFSLFYKRIDHKVKISENR